MLKLDALDKKIINHLNQDARARYSQIAKKVRASKEVVNYRLRRLQEQGIIKEFITVFGFKYWPYKVLIQFEKISENEEKEIVDYLVKHNRITWVTSCSGSWDLIFVIKALNPNDFDTIFREVLGKFGKSLQNYSIAVTNDSEHYGHTYIVGSVHQPKRTPLQDMKFDEKDKKICQVLAKTARSSVADVSATIKIPMDTVHYRIKRMEKSNVIKRYQLILDPSKLKYHRYAIFIRCVNLPNSIITKFREFSKEHPNVVHFSKCVGSWDIGLTVHFASPMEFKQFLLDIRELFGSHIHNYKTVTLFETFKYSFVPDELL